MTWLLTPPREQGVTFAEPGDGRSFAERLAAGYGEADRLLPPQGAEAERLSKAASDLIATAAEEGRLARHLSSRNEALAEAAERRIETVRQQTGVQLENPYRGGYRGKAIRRRREEARGGGTDDQGGVPEMQMRIFLEQVDDVARRFPDRAAALQFFQSLDEQAGAIATAAEDAATNARREYAAAGGTTLGGFTAEVLGGLWGARRDPLSLGSLVFGPTAAGGRTALARVFTAASAQGLFNVGVQALEHQEIRDWKIQRGVANPGGLMPSAGEIGLAFALGAIPGGAIQGVIEARGAAALRRVLAGEGSAADVPAALRAMGLPPDSDLAALMNAGRRSVEADELIAKSAPQMHPDVTDDVARAVMSEHAGNPIAGVERLRADPDLIESALVSPQAELQTAGRLATLSDEAWAMVRNGEADPLHAALVTDLTGVAEDQASILRRVIDGRPQSIEEARELAIDAVEAMAERRAMALPASIIGDEPSMPAGTVRLYHGGQPESSAGSLWFSSQRSYAQGYANKSNGKVWYVDLPAEHPLIVPDYAEQSIGAGFHRNVELPPELARQRKLLNGDTSRAETFPPRPDDPLEHVPFTRDDGSAFAMPRDAIERAGERDGHLADLVRTCRT